MTRTPSASGLSLPMPGSPSSSWALYRARLSALFHHADTAVVIAFWLFGLINNVLYVIILSAAQDLVGGTTPKGVVLLADIMPSFLTKLVAPYFIHRIPYAARIPILVALSTAGMLLIALTPPSQTIAIKLVGVVLASLSSGGGELSFLSLTHYYGHLSLAAWGSGTGGAGLIGAGLYVLLTDWIGFSVRGSLLASAFLPGIMLVAFFVVLPRGVLRGSGKEYTPVPGEEEDGDAVEEVIPASSAALLAPEPGGVATAYATTTGEGGPRKTQRAFVDNLQRTRKLFFPYMLPLLLVYVAEYTINQGVSPTLLFPLDSSPFTEYRSFYPFYGFLYQIGVFISRSSTPFIRIHHLYLPSLLQVGNLVLLTLHAVLNFIPSVYIVFLVIFWEGLLGGAVYVNTFAEIMENVADEDREFSLGATSVSDSGGVMVAAFISVAIEGRLCAWQVSHGRDWCRRIEPS